MSYNVQLMQHMTDCVKNWGPLWGYSAHSSESANGLFLMLFHGTQLFINIRIEGDAACVRSLVDVGGSEINVLRTDIISQMS